MILGSLAVSTGAILIAAPLGIFSAIHIHYFAPKYLGHLLQQVVEIFSAIPSVVVGFWGLMTIVPWIASFQPPGTGLLTGILILTLMIFPTMTLIVGASFTAFPAEVIRSSIALGISRKSLVFKIIMPSIRAQLYTALILQAGRALGETMVVLMVCGNVIKNPDGLFAPVRTLTSNIALEMAYAMGPHRSALYISALFLISIGVTASFAGFSLQRSGNIVKSQTYP